MITPEIIQRINELAHKQKTAQLTESEQAEQTKLRRLYIEQVKANVRMQLDETINNPPHVHDANCSCGHSHTH